MNNDIVMSMLNNESINFAVNNENIEIDTANNEPTNITIDNSDNHIHTTLEQEPNVSMNIGNNNLEIDFQMSDTPTVSKNYNDLINQPRINSVVLINNRTSDELGLQPAGEYANSKITNIEIDDLFR